MPESHNREINIVTLARGDTCGLFRGSPLSINNFTRTYRPYFIALILALNRRIAIIHQRVNLRRSTRENIGTGDT